MTTATRLPRVERQDLLALASAIASVTLVWLLLGLRSDVLIGGNDSVAQVYPFLLKLVAVDGDWTRLVYDAGLLGGVKVHDVDGTLPLYSWLAWLGLSAANCHNLAILWFQASVAFAGITSARNLAIAWGAEGLELKPLEYAVMALPLAFMPMIGWRVGYGHMILLMGLLPMLACVLLLSAVAAKRLTLTSVLWAIIAMLNGFASQGQQMVLYGALFGLPMLLVLLWRALSVGGGRQVLAFMTCLVAGSWLVMAPRMAGTLLNAYGPDSVRSVGGASVVYSYSSGATTLGDLFSSLWWGRELIGGERDAFVLPETNLAIGAPLLLLLLAPLLVRSSKFLVVAMCGSGLVAVLFSLRVEPVPSLLQALVPPLAAFRVPGRAAVPVLMLIPVVGLGALMHWRAQARSQDLSQDASDKLASGWRVAWGAAVLLGLFSPAVVREVICWGLVIATAIVLWRRPTWLSRSAWPVLLVLILAAASVAGFRERLLPFTQVAHLQRQAAGVGATARSAQPDLASPLTRAAFGFLHPDLGFNQGSFMGISTLDGYTIGSRRFIALADALASRPHRPLNPMHHFPPDAEEMRVLGQLYNVSAQVELQGGKVTARPLSTTGPAWFPQDQRKADGAKGLADVMGAHRQPLWRTLWLDGSDPAVGSAKAPASECADSRVLEVSARDHGQRIQVHATSAASCPLVVATNYFSTVHASSGGLKLPTFAAYGPLLGVQLPRGEHRLEISFDAHQPLWSWAVAVPGAVMLFGALFVLRRRVYH